ncbi:MAG: hypothetical protein ACFCUG_06900 [Thiotrichales bacterium]
MSSDAGAAGSLEAVRNFWVEPALLPVARELLPDPEHIGSWVRHADLLERRICRNPRDLLSHAQRVSLHLARADAARCFHALVDLNIALGRQGRALRVNLLEQTLSLLPKDQFEWLLRRLDSGVAPDEVAPDMQGVLLSRSVAGVTAIVALDARDGAADTDQGTAIKQVWAWIEQGRIDDARMLLERTLDDDPGDPIASMELLALYRRHDLGDAFTATYTRLSGRRLALPELWDKLSARFRLRTSALV